MPSLILSSRDDYIRFVEVHYFGNVRAADHETVLGFFAPDATLTGYAGDAPARVMRKKPTAGEGSLEDFMKAAEHFDLTYSDFVHHIDLEAERVASRFTLVMAPKPGGAMAHMPTRRLKNCNFFQFENGLLIDVVAYFSNPKSAATDETA